ncbi:hypothetical protein OG948_60035 (plasmid) [Embleya sp. NBC_00888]|uniref:hypothetical protein n=1 Tax=Embleya sp. NBC_00888 TaxID=2975960 RepID=UPI002F90EF75|nr:hypothetical protein OG948_60035 [Embleya sp. NBC_00888]
MTEFEQVNISEAEFDEVTSTSTATEDDNESDAFDGHTYSPASLSRLVLSEQATIVAERAIGLAVIREDEFRPDGRDERDREAILTLIATRNLAEHVQALLRAAVVHTQTSGIGWERIATVLGQTRQSVARKHGPAVEEWRTSIVGPDGRPGLPRTHRAEDAAALAHELDAWLREHAARPSGPQDAAISERLGRLGAAEELDLLLAHSRGALPPAELAAVRERQTVLYERFAAAEDDPEQARRYRRYAAHARDQTTELRESLAPRPNTADTDPKTP